MKLALALLLVSTPALAAPLVMNGHDGAHATYADKCSNGRNADAATRTKFIAAMQADKASKLAVALADLAKEPDRDVVVGDWILTFNERTGCSDLRASYSAIVFVRAKAGTGHEVGARLLVTIDDDVAADQRTLSLRSIQPLALRK